MGTMERILRLMAERQASDVYLSPKAAALIRINGQCMPINGQVLPVSAPLELLREIIDEKRMAEFERTGELNTAVPLRDVGSFRVSAMRQRGSCAVVVRFIPVTVPAFDTLALPPVLKSLIMERRGLVLMVGATGSGKSTTLASMIDLRNESTPGHILTIEEPIEFAFQNKKSVVNQREVGNDTATLETALKNALRQAPDVILIGEIRDRETMTAALAYAQSGHLVLATLHANNAYRALNRIQSFYPLETRSTLLNDMASGLRAVIAQRLLRTPQGSRVPAVEVMLNTALVRDLIERGDFDGIKDAMEHSMAEGSQTFEEAIAKLVLEGKVSRDEALVHADSPANLMWRLQNENRPRDGASAKSGSGEPSLMQQTEAPTFTDITLDVHPG